MPSTPRFVRQFAQSALVPILNRLYEFAVNYGGGWKLEWLPRTKRTPPEKRIGYYLWQFPVTSQTFVRREVQALRAAGIGVEIFADEPGDYQDSALAATTHYLNRERAQLARQKKFFQRTQPLTYWNVLVFTLLHRYGDYKTWREDIFVFESAVCLAGTLRAQHITHLHAPWADRTAFVALLAAQLLNIPFSVQARAHDLHRTKFQYALHEKFAHAQFIVTNSDYNARAIATYLDTKSNPPIHVIRNLFPLEQFQLNPHDDSTPLNILCVARLIEEKGLVYLLHACAQLRARGMAFCCEIIGAPEEPEYTSYWIQLKRLYQQLGLSDVVTFAGGQPFEKILDAYTRADLFVLPCVIAENGGRDVSPNSLIEAMAMGLPVISTQLSAIPEIVEHGVSGILVPPNDAQALADAMHELMHNPARRRELGARARERVQARYDARKNVRQYAALFGGTLPQTDAVE